ncbi:MAG: DNA-binding transcriptional regulator GbsR (MarR family) [Colwellia sp.]|jgi:DNA-binding transcriptional regulator GbsR (MarR family)
MALGVFMEESTPDSTIHFYNIFEIESESNAVRQIELHDASSNDVLVFVKKLANNAKYGQSQRQATFIENSEVKKLLVNAVAEDNQDEIVKIAEHLLECEVEYNSKKGSFNTIRKGSLLVSNFESNNQNSILIAKIDIENFFETEQLKLLKGLPQDKGMYKTCLINISKKTLDTEISLSDTNTTISKFWWHDFLDCDFVRDAQKNTDLAFSRLSSALTHVNKVSPVDHAFLKGNLTSYFTTASHFDVDEMIERVVGSYEPENKDVNTIKIKENLKKTCSSGKFDTNFEIDITPIKGKLKRTIKIDEDIELKIKSGDVSKIYHFEHQRTNYVAIKAKSGYANFRKLDIKND